MLRSRFQSLPGAFNACLIPEEKSEIVKKKGLMATFSRKFEVVRVFLLLFVCVCTSSLSSLSSLFYFGRIYECEKVDFLFMHVTVPDPIQ